MVWTDLPLDELREFRSSVVAAPDLRAFWDGRLAEARSAAVDITLSEVESPLTRTRVRDLKFGGTRAATPTTPASRWTGSAREAQPLWGLDRETSRR